MCTYHLYLIKDYISKSTFDVHTGMKKLGEENG